jgi:regulator of nucleoside diphosphate kinase
MLPDICISSRDFERIENLLDALPQSYSDVKTRLFAELGRADVVDSSLMPPDVVTMNSRVTFTVLSTGQEITSTLVYPDDKISQINSGDRLSILSPVGTALLGLSEGSEIEWPVDLNKNTRVRIDAIDYQPERSGDYHL